MKITQLYIDDFGLPSEDRDALINTGGRLRNLKDDSVVGNFHGVLSSTPVGSSIRNRVYNSLKNPRPDGVSTVLLKPLKGTVVNVKSKATWLESQKLTQTQEELSNGTFNGSTSAVGLRSAIFANNVVGQEAILASNSIISPKTNDSYSAYVVKNKRLWVAVLVVDVAGNSTYIVPTPYSGVYYYKANGGDENGNTGTIKPWSFPDVNDAAGISTTSYSIDLPLAGQVIDTKQVKSGNVSANYVIESDILKNDLSKVTNQQFVIYVPYETLQTAQTANQGPIKFVKSGEVYNSVSSGTFGTGVSINEDNVLLTSAGDTISSTNSENLRAKKVEGKKRVTIVNNSSTPSILEVGIAAAAGVLGAKFLTSDKQASDAISITKAIDTVSSTTRQVGSSLFGPKN